MSEQQHTLLAAVDELAQHDHPLRIAGETVPLDATHRDAWPALYQASYIPRYRFSLDQARAEWHATLDGAYGTLWNDASPQFLVGGALVGSLLSVHQAPWDDVPPGPFVIELIVDPAFRRNGIAAWLLRSAAEVCREAGQSTLALRVLDTNASATALYARLGFRAMRR